MTMPKHLAIIGAGGMLGSKLVEKALMVTDAHITAFVHSRIPVLPIVNTQRVTWATLDIGNAQAVHHALLQARPTVVINTAAMTNVDACESQRAEALLTNTTGPHHLATTCVMLDSHLIHVSTDYVFSGANTHPGPYYECDQVGPVNWYGQTKLDGERSVMQVCADHIPWLIARTAQVYGDNLEGRTNFITWMVNKLRAGCRVKVVNDQFNTPTLVDDLALTLLQLAQHAGTGIYHLAGPDLISREAWACAIATHYNLDGSLIEVITTEELQQQAPRPLYSGLRSHRLHELPYKTLHGIHDGLKLLAIP